MSFVKRNRDCMQNTDKGSFPNKLSGLLGIQIRQVIKDINKYFQSGVPNKMYKTEYKQRRNNVTLQQIAINSRVIVFVNKRVSILIGSKLCRIFHLDESVYQL